MLAQEIDRAPQLVGEAVDFLGGGGEGQAGARRGAEAVMAVQRLGAVVAAANADPGRIEQGGDVVGVQAFHMKGGKRAAMGLALGIRPQHPHALDGPQPGEQQAGEVLLPGGDALHAKGDRGGALAAWRKAEAEAGGKDGKPATLDLEGLRLKIWDLESDGVKLPPAAKSPAAAPPAKP